MEEKSEDLSEDTNNYVTVNVAVEDADMPKDVPMEVTEDRDMPEHMTPQDKVVENMYLQMINYRELRLWYWHWLIDSNKYCNLQEVENEWIWRCVRHN